MSSRPLGLALCIATLGAFAAGLVPGCYGRRESDDPPPDPAACTGCHGDPNRKGDQLHNAAPPRDLDGNAAVGYAGVGAHQIHLNPSETHLAIECTECHVVPKTTRDKGHADSARPAELTFGALAKTGGRTPSFDDTTLRCSDTYCHRDADPHWLQPRSSTDACGSCHGIPPASPHPQVAKTDCALCHVDTMDTSGNIKDPSKHVNGKVDVTLGGCATCHGDPTEPDELLRGAPPKDLAGNTETTFIGVGAHQIHVRGLGNGRAVACNECHTVPTEAGSPGHADTPLPAEVTITGVATSNGHSPTWNLDTQKCSNTWCHGPDVAKDSPVWTGGTGGLPCTGCHGQPPPWPHVQMTECSRCHSETVNADNVTIKDKTKHANGTIDVTPPTGCTDCHGGAAGPAPPLDIGGNSATTAAGVGAHQSHLVGTGSSPWHRAVQCDDCHQVPSAWKDVGHIDTFLPAELTFGAIAKTNGNTPAFTNGKCENVYCHGNKLGSGGTLPAGPLTSPEWTKVDGSQAACGNCHALPPHPDYGSVCKTCHPHFDETTFTFSQPELHIDGKLN